MIAQIINIGDEILIGQIINTNGAFLSKSLNSIGITVSEIISISDKKEDIIKQYSLKEFLAPICE